MAKDKRTLKNKGSLFQSRMSVDMENNIIKKDFETLLQEAENGNIRAQYDVAECYFYGNGVEENHCQAEKWYLKAAESGNADAQYRLWQEYCEGAWNDSDNIDEREELYEKGLHYLNLAYNQGHWDAILEGSYEDSKIEYMRKKIEIAKQGYVKAQYSVAEDYFNGLNVKEDKAAAIMWYEKAALLGHEVCQYKLAECYFHGIGVKRDLIKSREWHRKAAEQGNVQACFRMGEYFDKGIGVEVDKISAIKWYELASKCNKEVTYRLAEIYYHGDGVEKNIEEAIKWYEKAAKYGHADAEYRMGHIWYYGEGVEANKEIAREWYRKAAEHGHLLAKYEMGRFCWEQSQKERKLWIKEPELKYLLQAYDYLAPARNKGILEAKELLITIYKDRRCRKILYKHGRGL